MHFCVYPLRVNIFVDLVQLCSLKEFAGDEAGQHSYIIDWGTKKTSALKQGRNLKILCFLCIWKLLMFQSYNHYM